MGMKIAGKRGRGDVYIGGVVEDRWRLTGREGAVDIYRSLHCIYNISREREREIRLSTKATLKTGSKGHMGLEFQTHGDFPKP